MCSLTECYNPVTDSWSVVGDMPSSRSGTSDIKYLTAFLCRSWLSAVALTIRKDLGKDKLT